ncbi:MAG: FMN-binding protein [Bacillota bacterium]|nr:FMN-binding protein [Bacillota bacterium]
MAKRILAMLMILALVLTVTSCGDVRLKDGTYTRTSSKDEHGFIEVTVVIKDGKIADCTMKMFNVDGTLKGEDYGKNAGNPKLYELAQKALGEASKLPALLVEKGDIAEVDALSGATKTYDQFKAMVLEIVEEAQKP